jgi:hypothetical protein
MGYRDIAMPEETKNSAVSGEWKLVPMALLKKWHRDLDACQKVMWLRGGFDPAYCMDAQDCLKEMEGVLAAPVPPAGGDLEVLAWRAHGFNFSTEAIAHDYNKWAEEKQPVQYLVDRAHVTRLQAENAALQQRLNVADQRVDELERKAKLYDQLQRGAELLPEGWMITVEVERDGGGVTLIDPQGNDLDYPSNRESMGDEVEDAIEEALAQQVTP